MADFFGDSGDNSIAGTADADNFFMHQGGDDTVQAGGGDDSVFFAGAYTHNDVVDGGDGNDRVNLQGDYSAGVTVDFTNVETLQLSSGGFDYKIAVAADCFAVDGGFTFDASALNDSDNFSADLTADSAGQTVEIYDFSTHFAIKGGAANETFGYISSVNAASGSFSGGEGDDSVALSTSDFGASKLNGGKGFDSLILQRDGDYDFTPAMLKQFETIVMVSHSDVGFSLTMSDANVARGHSLWIDGGGTTTMTFDGSTETNGAYSVTGGAGADSITGGAGGDTLSGGGEADHFIYTDVSQSSGHHKAYDLITDLEASDVIDLSAIDARTDKAGDQAFHIVGHFTGAAGELVLSYSAGKDLTTIAGDIDGDGKADISIHVAGDHTDFTNFAL